MAILNSQEEYKKRKAQQQPAPDMTAPMKDNRDDMNAVREPFQEMAQSAEIPPMPNLQYVDPEEMRKSQWSQYVQSFDNWADAEKDGRVSQQEWANERINKMISEGKNPGAYENILSLYGSAETPEDIKKRQRREQLGETFRNLGSLIGNAANLYYTNKGGQYIDLNTPIEKHRERMERIKIKQDALNEKMRNTFINAKLGDIKNERAIAAAERKHEQEQAQKDLQYNRDLLKLQIQDAYRRGQIDLQSKNRLEEQAQNAKDAEKLESIRQQGRVTVANINNESKSNRSNKSKSTLTYNGKEYKKNDLASLKKLYEQLREDGYTVKEVKDSDTRNVTANDYTKAILGAGKVDPTAVGGIRRADILDSDVRDVEDDESTAKTTTNSSLGIGIGKSNKNKLGIGL